MVLRTIRWLSVAWVLCGLAVAAQPACAGGRVALVIGNSAYGGRLGDLRNPANDAELIAQTLKRLGFKVDLVLNADQKGMKRAVKAFGAALLDAGHDTIGLFYFAGHGVQVAGENFLIPVKAEIATEGDVSIEALAARDVLAQMQFAGNAVNLIFLDACRNNPLARGFRSAETGLARVDAPRGSFVGYSTAPGELAADGDGANSPYATALAEELAEPGISIEVAHRKVRGLVMQMTNGAQTPWDSSSLIGEVVLAGKAPQGAPAPAPTPDSETLFWETIKDSSDAADFKAYIKNYPHGVFVDLARNRLEALAGRPADAAAVRSTADAGKVPTDARLARALSELGGMTFVQTTFDGHLLIAVAEEATFPEALATAREVGGYLANIGSAAENDAIFAMIRDQPRFWWKSTDGTVEPDNGWIQGPYIGLYQEAGAKKSRSGWVTADGGKPAYTNWSKDQPNEADLGQGPGAATFGGLNENVPFAKWSDQSISQGHRTPGYVIEIE